MRRMVLSVQITSALSNIGLLRGVLNRTVSEIINQFSKFWLDQILHADNDNRKFYRDNIIKIRLRFSFFIKPRVGMRFPDPKYTCDGWS